MTGHHISVRPNALAKAIARHDAMNEAWGGMLDNGLHGGPAYDLARDRFNALRDATRDEARAAQPQQNAA